MLHQYPPVPSPQHNPYIPKPLKHAPQNPTHPHQISHLPHTPTPTPTTTNQTKKKEDHNTHHNNLIIRHLDLPPILRKFHLRGPIAARLVARVVVVSHVAVDHEVVLVGAVRVDLDGFVVAAGDVGPDCFAEGADFWACLSREG